MSVYLAPAVIVGNACVLRRSSLGPRVVRVRHLVATLLPLVKYLLFAIVVSSVFITGVEAAVGKYPRLVLRESQPITDCRPISKRGTSETA